MSDTQNEIQKTLDLNTEPVIHLSGNSNLVAKIENVQFGALWRDPKLVCL